MTVYTMNQTKSSPLIKLDPTSGIMEIKGESYPENCTRFYGPMFEWLQGFFAKDKSRKVELNMEVVYFNSSTSKTFMDLFDLLDDEARKGRAVNVNWLYHPENETAMECGEEFQEDVESLQFNLVEKAG